MSEPFLRSRPGAGGGFDQRKPAGSFNREDPLAELARLVGKDDPFRSADPRAPASNVASFPQLTPPAAREPELSRLPAEDDGIGEFHEPGYPDFDARLRGSLDGLAAEDARPRDALRFPMLDQPEPLFEPSPGEPAAERGNPPPLNADLWAEGALPQGGEPADYDTPVATSGDDGRSSRRTVMVLAAVLALVGGGLGATFLMKGGSSAMVTSDGAPPTIKAADTPVKVPSPDVANGGTPDSNTALLEKTNSDKVDKAKVVANNEQPVDLNQLPKPASAQPEAPPPAAATQNSFPEPRKVKTVMIRPDGSVVGDAPAQPAPQPPIGMTMPAGADGDAQPAGVQPPAASPAPVAKPSTPKSTARVATTPKDTAASGGASGASAAGAKQAAAPAHMPKPKPVATAENDAAEEPAAAAPGTWSVQLAAPPTEQDAKETAGRLQRKFAGELGGAKLSVHKAADKAVYRVRVGSLSQDDAKALCGKLQAAGGSCFTVRN